MKRLLLCLLSTFLCLNVEGQQIAPIIPEVIPPGPTAAELGRYGLVPVNMHTGNTNVNIPLYDFRTKNLHVPISLSYNSNAIQVDEVASWVGMHWSLNAGGVITRTVRDQPDRFGGIPYPEDFSMHDAMSIWYIQHIAQTPEMEDKEPDIYAYNFLGYTGKLVFDRDGTPVTIPRNDLVFEGSLINDYLNGFIVTTPDGVKHSFKEVEMTSITGSGEGTYGVPTSWYLTKIEHPSGDVIELTYANDYYNYPLSISSTSSRLTNNPSCPTGQTCPGQSDNSTLSHLGMQGKMLASIHASGHGSLIFQATTGRSDLQGGHKLSSFYVRNHEGQTVKSFTLDYAFSSNTGFKNPLALAYEGLLIKRMFLTQVVEMDRLTNEAKKYIFEYEDFNALPARLSNARDHWGYFNGASNSSIFPETLTAFNQFGQLAFPQYNANRKPNSNHAKKGLLKRITYPTGGSSEFLYEGNTYYGTHQVYPNKNYSYLEVTGIPEQYDNIVSDTLITSGVDQIVRLNVSCSYKYGFSTSSGHGKFAIFNQQGNSIFDRNISAGESRVEYVRLLGGQQYTFKVIAEGPPPDGMWANNTITTMNFQHYATSPASITENIETGGVRIASITNHDPVTGKDDVINYLYARHNQLSQSSGKKMGLDPDYVTKYTVEQTCQPGFNCISMLCTYVSLHSSGMNTLFRSNGNHLYYEYVTISRGTGVDTGLEEHQFIVRGDRQGTLVWGTDDIPGTPLSNTGWDNGLEKAIRYYKKEGSTLTLLRTIDNAYTKDSRYHKEIPGLSFRRKYWPQCVAETQAVFQCDASNIDKKIKVYKCTTDHNHWFYTGMFSSGGLQCIAPGKNMDWVVIGYHPCYGRTAGETAYVPTNLNFVDAVQYENISDWFYLSKQTVTTYNENGLNPIVQETNYYYDNEAHTQLARQITTSSAGKTIEVQYKYPRDYEPAPGDAIELMGDYSWNMVAMPIEQIRRVDGQVIAASATGYDIFPVNENGNIVSHFIAPKDIFRFEATLPTTGFAESTDGKTFGSYTKNASIHEYDDKGNILDVSKEDDLRIAYIWGYDGKFPVAKIVNAAYSSIPIAIINDIKAKSNLDDDHCRGESGCNEANLRTSLNGLRSLSALSNAQITTYTYDSLVGMTSETDPNGNTIYYEYDDLGRLAFIRDHNGNIVRTLEYNYQKHH